MRNNKILKIFFVFLTCILFIFIIFQIINYFNSTVNVKVYYKNSSEVKISEFHGEHTEEKGKYNNGEVQINKSGEEVRLKKNKSFIVSYKAREGYSDKFIIFNPSNQRIVRINPFFSDKKLKNILNDEEVKINNTITISYKNINLYSIKQGKLYHFGDWYGTTLQYLGDNYENSDSLRVILKKENDKWIIKTDPPQIILSKVLYPNIPVDILSDVNSQKVNMLDKFVNPDKSHILE